MVCSLKIGVETETRGCVLLLSHVTWKRRWPVSSRVEVLVECSALCSLDAQHYTAVQICPPSCPGTCMWISSCLTLNNYPSKRASAKPASSLKSLSAPDRLHLSDTSPILTPGLFSPLATRPLRLCVCFQGCSINWLFFELGSGRNRTSVAERPV